MSQRQLNKDKQDRRKLNMNSFKFQSLEVEDTEIVQNDQKSTGKDFETNSSYAKLAVQLSEELKDYSVTLNYSIHWIYNQTSKN